MAIGTLRLLGGARLETEAGALTGRVAQRRQLAVLAYLCLSPAPVSRDRLIAVFWPEADPERGRHALSDVLYIIRRALGEEAIRSLGDDVRVNRSLVRCDAAEFDEALAGGRHEEAVQLYSGPLLDGCHLSDAPDFENWLASRREEYRIACAAAAEAVARARDAAGQRGDALVWWRRAASLDPHNSRTAIGLAHAQAATGDRAGAVRHLASHRVLIESEFGVAAPGELLELETELRRGGAQSSGLANRAASEELAPPQSSPANPDESSLAARRLLAAAGAHASAPRRWRRVGAVLVVAAILLLGGAAVRAMGWAPVGNADADPRTIAVFSLRTAGVDPALAYLGSGVPELIAAKLASTGSDIRPVFPDAPSDPTRAGTRAARALGAGRLLTGGLVGTPENLTIHVEVTDVRTGRETSRAIVSGAEPELHALIDRLVAQLVSIDAGEEEHRIADLTSRSLPALRVFLEARAAHRRGDYATALSRYAEAMNLDSTFALAGLGATQVAGWVGGSGPIERRGAQVIERHRHRLSPRDLVGRLGRLDAVRTQPVTGRLHLEERERALQRWPDHPVLWYLQGDVLLHRGAALGLPRFEARARESFERAIELDPNYAEPVHHLAALLGSIGDTAALRRLATAQLRRLSSGPVADHLRWRAWHALHDPAFAPPAIDSMDPDATLRWIGIEAQDYGFAIDDGDSAVRVRMRAAGTRDEKLERGMGVFAYALNRGRPSEAVEALAALEDQQPDEWFLDRVRVLTALYADGDATAAAAAARRLAETAATGEVGELNRCVLALWHLRPGSAEPVPRPAILSDAGAAARDSRPWAVSRRLCALARDARWLARAGDGELPSAIRRLDDLLDKAPVVGLTDNAHTEWVHLELARLHEAVGNATGALRALDRRTRYNGWQPYLATILREEGRLAAKLGDTARAKRAWEHYVAFRPRAAQRRPPVHGAA